MSEFCKASTMPRLHALVVGGRGFIGMHTVQALVECGHAAYSYDKVDMQDILDFAEYEDKVKSIKPNWIIHLAGQVNLAPSFSDPQNDAKINIIGTLNTLEIARKYGCGVTFTSSGAVYGNNYQYPEPISPYGISKLTSERYCQLYYALYGLHTVVFRFSSVYGMGRAPTSINLILNKAMKGEAIKITGDGQQTRDFTYVTDVAKALVMSAEDKFPSGVYDIGTGTATSLNELLGIISRLLDKELTIEHVAENVGDPKRNELNVSKAAMYGFKAKISLEEGLKDLIRQTKNGRVGKILR